MRVPVNAGDAEAVSCRFSSQHGVDDLQETKEKTCIEETFRIHRDSNAERTTFRRNNDAKEAQACEKQ